MHSRTLDLLLRVGLGPKELSHLNRPVFHNIPHDPTGYGLIGGTGSVKTSQFVRRLAEEIDAFVTIQAEPEKAGFPVGLHRPYLRWVNWPVQAEVLKRLSAMSCHREIYPFICEWKETGILVLDDMGQERTSSDRDYALGVFGEVLDTRYRFELPIFWTSNLEPEQLIGKYGSRLMSRLFEVSPFVRVDSKDQRLKNRKKPPKAV